tara:strand:+ start:7794 stop:8480 length:687 start_codon:yes stop_codon:yes gene_type:complete
MNLTISPNSTTALKICGITKIEQALKIASFGVNAIGVIGVESSPRFVNEVQRRKIFEALINSKLNIDRVLVVADINDSDLNEILNSTSYPSIIQLHGNESPKRCEDLKKKYPMFKWWKAFRLQKKESLSIIKKYETSVDAFLLDTWSKNKLGGTGQRLPIEWLQNAEFNIPWWLAGGMSKDSISEVLSNLNPYGIDASSKLEHSPGIKDIEKVKALINEILIMNTNIK